MMQNKLDKRILRTVTPRGVRWIGSAVLATACLACGPPHPTDEQLISLFQQNSEDFETLRRMIMKDDGVASMNYRFHDHIGIRIVVHYFPCERLSRQRWRDYRELFRALDLENGITRTMQNGIKQGDRVRFNVSSQGLSISGSSKDIVYASEPPSPVVESLDNWVPVDSWVAYRHITGNWYLMYSFH